MAISETLLAPLVAKGKFWCRSRQMVVRQNREAHQIDPQNVLNAKMCVCGRGSKKLLGSKVVKIGQIWPADFRHRHFIIEARQPLVIAPIGPPTALYPPELASQTNHQ